jgi:hypothetical protein
MHPSPHDTASGAVWDGSGAQMTSHEGWNGLQNKMKPDDLSTETTKQDQTAATSSESLEPTTTPTGFEVCYFQRFIMEFFLIMLIVTYSWVFATMPSHVCLVAILQRLLAVFVCFPS